MIQWLKALAVPPVVLSSIPINTRWLTVAYSDLMPYSGMQVYMQMEHSCAQKEIFKEKN